MNTNNKYDLSIIVPCYNESRILRGSVNEVMKVMGQTRLSYEIIFVDDKSRDGTQKLIQQIVSGNENMRCIFHSENTGRGKAVVDGIKMAKGDIVGFIDIDLEVHARYVPSMVMAIKEDGFDIATAYRIYKVNSAGLLRHIVSFSYRRLVRAFLKLPLKDTETGFKFFKKEKILPLIEKTKDKGWFWDTEISYLAFKNNLKIIEIPCVFIRRNDKPSTVNILKDGIDYLRKLWAFSREVK
jgi:glycosyltransferase involved in cell wall biosynthesis